MPLFRRRQSAHGSSDRERGAVHIGTVSGEGGPFLIVDRAVAEAWRGSDDISDYDQVMSLPAAGGGLRVGTSSGVAWEAEGGATASVYRLDASQLLMQREWAANVDPIARPDGAERIGALNVATGDLVIFWSPLAWEDFYEPVPPGVHGELSTPSMGGVGIQVQVPPGSYECSADYADDAYRCWISRT